jgi:catalase
VFTQRLPVCGKFEAAHDNSGLADTKFLNGVGKKTKPLQVIDRGRRESSSDTVREVRGLALRSFTEDGDQEFAFNDLPVSFIRDPTSSQI